MKKIMLSLLLSLSLSAFAHCPNELIVGEKEVCFTYEWVDGPFLNGGSHHHMAKSSGKPRPSTLEVRFWDHNDSSHSSIQLDGLIVYPWMIMNNGMEHGARPVTLTYDGARGAYTVSNIYFSKMMGYWEMRLAFLSGDDFDPKSDYVHNFVVDFE